MRRAVVHLRVSTIEQTTANQERELREIAGRMGCEIVRIFYTLREAQIVIESWRRHYNTIRPHASLGYKPPAPEVFLPAFAAWPAALPQPAPPATLAKRPTLN